MPRPRRASTSSANSSTPSSSGAPQEMASMYDYLAKVILLGPSGSGKTCLLHRFVKNEWRVLCSQTIGVEFASRIIKVGPPGRRKRIKLQLWDTAGTERFRSVSRSYYRGAAGAVLVYDVADPQGLGKLRSFLDDVRALASPQVSLVLAGNKVDIEDSSGEDEGEEDLMDMAPHSLASSTKSSTLDRARGIGLGAQQRATKSVAGRAVPSALAGEWASTHRVPITMDVSALTGDNVEAVFHKLAATILTKIELGEIDPSDPNSGIQYGDGDYYDGGSVRSGMTNDEAFSGSVRRRRGKRGIGLESMFGGGGGGASGRKGRCC